MKFYYSRHSIYIIQDPENPGRKFPPGVDYSTWRPPPPLTRLAKLADCPCSSCEYARLERQDCVSHKKQQSGKVGRPSSVPEVIKRGSLKVCDLCLSEIGPGKRHKCSDKIRNNNMIDMINSSSTNSKSNVIVNSLKTLAKEEGVSVRGGCLNLKSESQVMPVQIGTARTKPETPQFSHEHLRSLQLQLNLSNNETK